MVSKQTYNESLLASPWVSYPSNLGPFSSAYWGLKIFSNICYLSNKQFCYVVFSNDFKNRIKQVNSIDSIVSQDLNLSSPHYRKEKTKFVKTSQTNNLTIKTGF